MRYGILKLKAFCLKTRKAGRQSEGLTAGLVVERVRSWADGSGAAHAVAAVEAAVAGAAADGEGAAVVAGGGVALEVGELLVANFDAAFDGRRGMGGVGDVLGVRVVGAEFGLGVFEVGDGRGALAVDFDEGDV